MTGGKLMDEERANTRKVFLFLVERSEPLTASEWGSR